ncbi:hypothetical protein AB3S75_006614 [Citrus x aurantiifolia]
MSEEMPCQRKKRQKKMKKAKQNACPDDDEKDVFGRCCYFQLDISLSVLFSTGYLAVSVCFQTMLPMMMKVAFSTVSQPDKWRLMMIMMNRVVKVGIGKAW